MAGNMSSSEAFFARLAVGILPPPLSGLIRERGLGVMDWGGTGGALPVLAEAFPGSKIGGMGGALPVPVVYTANALQKFAQPLGVLRAEVLPAVGDYLIVLVPYQELPLSSGHLCSFNATSFPPRLDELGMIFWRAVSTGALPGSPWPGQQLMVIYARRQAAGIEQLIPALMEWEAQVVKRG